MDETFAGEAPRETLFGFATTEDGVMEETKYSVARRIHDLFGFDASEVSLMEGDGLEVAMLGRGYRVFTAPPSSTRASDGRHPKEGPRAWWDAGPKRERNQG